MTVRVLTGDVFDRLAELPDESVHCVVTSAPYWGLRDYGVEGAIGLEPTFDDHLDVLVRVFREVRRVLRKDGTCWLNYGDAYAGSWGAQSRGDASEVNGLSGGQVHAAPKGTHTGSAKRTGLKPKDLMMMPARVALALQADGWWLRSEIVWSKLNPMPESVTDRPTSAHEKFYLLTKSARYFYDAVAVREVCQSGPSDIRKMKEQRDRIGGKHKALDDPLSKASGATNIGRKRSVGDPSGRNLRNVWTIATHSFPSAHFAVMPTAIVEPCIKSGTSEKGCCAECGAPWVRSTNVRQEVLQASNNPDKQSQVTGWDRAKWPRTRKVAATVGWQRSCDHDAGPIPCTVLDPFGGSGTVGLVGDQLGRDAVLIELNPEYVEMARRRIRGDAPLLTEVAS